jgi:hypothetical protein
MGKMVTHSITLKGVIYGRAEVNCSEDEHHPEKLIGDVDWDTSDIEWLEVVDDDIIDGWEEPDEKEEEKP